MTNLEKLMEMSFGDVCKLFKTTPKKIIAKNVVNCSCNLKFPCADFCAKDSGNCEETFIAWLDAECEDTQLATENKPEQVVHPSHYNKPGRLECFEEMKILYGIVPLYYFCLLNSYKYFYRAGDKAGNPKEQDVAKAKNYAKKADELLKELVEK